MVYAAIAWWLLLSDVLILTLRLHVSLLYICAIVRYKLYEQNVHVRSLSRHIFIEVTHNH